MMVKSDCLKRHMSHERVVSMFFSMLFYGIMIDL